MERPCTQSQRRLSHVIASHMADVMKISCGQRVNDLAENIAFGDRKQHGLCVRPKQCLEQR